MYSKRILTIISTVSLALIQQAAAFYEYGHLVVARIAWDELQKTANGQNALNKATQLLHQISQKPDNEALGDKSVVECATYADWIKTRSMNGVKGDFQFNWHTVRNPLLDAGKSLKDYPEFHLVHDNVERAIPELVEWLKSTTNQCDDDVYRYSDSDDCPDDDLLLKKSVENYKDSSYKDSFVYKDVMRFAGNNEQVGRSVALRLLIHYIGDIHQPLHAITKVNAQFKGSDHIGTFYKLDGENTLHSLWDEAVDQYNGEKVALPLTDKGFNRLG